MTRPRELPKAANVQDDEKHIEQVEYLLEQSAHGYHFVFEHEEIARILREPTDDSGFFNFENMGKAQDMLTKFLERPSLAQKKLFLETLKEDQYKLLVRAYFHLVENSIQANQIHKH